MCNIKPYDLNTSILDLSHDKYHLLILLILHGFISILAKNFNDSKVYNISSQASEFCFFHPSMFLHEGISYKSSHEQQ